MPLDVRGGMVGSRAVACLVLLSFLALPASASLLEKASGGIVAYQFDGETHHDAPGMCDVADPAWKLPLGGTTDGMLVPPDDLADVFVVDVPADDVGSRVAVRLMEGPGSIDLDLGVFVPACDGDVFAPHNQPVPFPAPPAPAAGQQQRAVDPTPPADACGRDWFFLINGLHGKTPASIHAAWTDGSEATVPLAIVENGEVGIYRTMVGAAYTLKGAWANLPASWNGTFKVAHEPCGITDGGAIYGDPAMLGNDRVSFTPIRSGRHIVVVTPATPTVSVPGTSVPLTCHLCFSEVEQLVSKASYVLSVEQLSA